MVLRRLKRLVSASSRGKDIGATKPTTGVQATRAICDPRCPYCSFEFSPPPTRRRRCSSCGNTVYVKTRPSDRQGILATTEQAEAIEQEWAREQRRTADAAWADLNKTLLAAMKRSDWQEMSGLYFEQALQLFEEGKPHFNVAQEARTAELQGYLSSGVVAQVQIITTRDKSCPSCQTLEGRQFTIEEALAQMPIPNPVCDTWKDEAHTNGWCRCLYVPVLK